MSLPSWATPRPIDTSSSISDFAKNYSSGKMTVPDFKGGNVPLSNTSVNPGSVSYPVSSAPVSSSGGSTNWAGIGSMLGGVGSIVGGILSYNQQKKANQIAQQQFAENLAFQKDQFYNSMFHRVNDAIHAGVHPLAALGVSAHGSASPTAHVQSATGLGQALQNAGSSINAYFDNVIKQKQVEVLDTQIASNKALAMKYGADAGRQISETALTNKDVDNYHLYRAWGAVNNSIGAITGGVRAGAAVKSSRRAINRYYGDIHFSD